MNKLTVVLCEDRVFQPTWPAIERAVMDGLAARPEVDVAVLPHLYDLSPDGPGMRYLQAVSGDLVVLAWLYPRATFWLLDANGIRGRMSHTAFLPDEELSPPPAAAAKQAGPEAKRGIWCIDLRGHEEPGPLLAEIGRILAEATGTPAAVPAPVPLGVAGRRRRIEEVPRQRWYPIVDYGRCGNCLECLNFCLFGVFNLDQSGRLVVEQPDACRNGCPACARVCPSGAIIFPQHANPAIAGDPRAAAESRQLNLVQLFGTAGAATQAAAERERALAEKANAEKAKAETPRPDASPARKPAAADGLDKLVDDLEDTDL
jgi:NAD-dependent dihydropyrimidine dehydrogenase PreA subunit